MQTKQTLWTKDFILLALCNLLVASGAFCLIPTLPIYAELVLNAGKSEVGYILGFYTLTALLIRPFSGIALDNLNRKIIYIFSMLAFILLMLFYHWATSLFFLYMLRLVHGLAWGVVTTGGNTIVADLVPPERRGEGIGYFGMSFTISMALGPVLGLLLITDNNFTMFFNVMFFVVLSAFVLALFVKYPKTNFTGHKKSGFQPKDLIDARALPIALVALLCSIVYAGLISFVTLYAKEMMIENSYLFFIFYAVGLTLIRPVAGSMMDKKGPKNILIFGFTTIMIGVLILASINEIIGFLLAAFITGLGMGTIFPTTITMIVNIVEPERRGVANSTFFSAVDIGVGIGAIVLGVVADMISIRWMYYGSILIILASFLYFVFFVNKDYEKKLALFKAKNIGEKV